MEATINHAATSAQARGWNLTHAIESTIAWTTRALAAIADGGEAGQLMRGPSSAAQFSLLPRSEQNRLLDRGYRF